MRTIHHKGNLMIGLILKKTVGLFKSLMPLLFVLGFLTACAVGPDYVRPTVQEPVEWMIKDDSKLNNEPANLQRWWTVFDDEVLNALIDKACRQNLSLQIAGVRILEARAQLGIAMGNLYPQSQFARAGYSNISNSETNANTTPGADLSYSQLELGFDVAWELDFWGKFRRAVQSGLGNLETSIAGYDDVLVTLTAETARTYVLIRTFETRLIIAKENVKIQKRSFQIADAQFKGGAVTELDVSQAISLLKTTQASIPRLETGLRQARNALAVLLGLLPEQIQEMLSNIKPIPIVPPDLAVGVPAELLKRRPDIRAAEKQLMAQSALIGVAKADLYPHLSLFGSIGLRTTNASITKAGFPGGSSLSDLFDTDSLEFKGGTGLIWDIFNYGRIKNRVRVQDARFQQLIMNYQNTVLKAFQEAEDAMAGFLNSQEEFRYLTDSVNAAKRSVDIAMIQYTEGLVDYQRVLDSQRSLAQQQDNLTLIQGNVATSLIALYKALGGGWEIRYEMDIVSEKIQNEMKKRTDWGDLIKP